MRYQQGGRMGRTLFSTGFDSCIEGKYQPRSQMHTGTALEGLYHGRGYSVMFCVAQAPAPARTQGQRLPTEMLEVVMAIPLMPDSPQVAVIEKVTGILLRFYGMSRSGMSAEDGQSLSSGITAVTSISTCHSGRASAVTTSPVEQGYTPLNHCPISR